MRSIAIQSFLALCLCALPRPAPARPPASKTHQYRSWLHDRRELLVPPSKRTREKRVARFASLGELAQHLARKRPGNPDGGLALHASKPHLLGGQQIQHSGEAEMPLIDNRRAIRERYMMPGGRLGDGDALTLLQHPGSTSERSAREVQSLLRGRALPSDWQQRDFYARTRWLTDNVGWDDLQSAAQDRIIAQRSGSKNTGLVKRPGAERPFRNDLMGEGGGGTVEVTTDGKHDTIAGLRDFFNKTSSAFVGAGGHAHTTFVRGGRQRGLWGANVARIYEIGALALFADSGTADLTNHSHIKMPSHEYLDRVARSLVHGRRVDGKKELTIAWRGGLYGPPDARGRERDGLEVRGLSVVGGEDRLVRLSQLLGIGLKHARHIEIGATGRPLDLSRARMDRVIARELKIGVTVKDGNGYPHRITASEMMPLFDPPRGGRIDDTLFGMAYNKNHAAHEEPQIPQENLAVAFANWEEQRWLPKQSRARAMREQRRFAREVITLAYRLQRTKDHWTEQGDENVARRQREAYDVLRAGLGTFLRSTDISRQAQRWLGMDRALY
jgi:hypothetical protein